MWIRFKKICVNLRNLWISLVVTPVGGGGGGLFRPRQPGSTRLRWGFAAPGFRFFGHHAALAPHKLAPRCGVRAAPP
ncbi:MAG: hypothetical protein WCI73_13260, partial [Phycisphaerae bacterium]